MPGAADSGSRHASPVSGLPFHDSTEIDPGERGWSFGTAQTDAVANTVDAYRTIFAADRIPLSSVRRSATTLRRQLASSTPDLLAEIAGIAAGAGQDVEDLIAINARTELRAAAPPECSTLAILPDSRRQKVCLMAQNWDYHPNLRASRILWRLWHSGGRFLTLTEAGIVAKIGMNSAGLGVCLNGMKTNRDGIGLGIPVHLLLREILERCSTFGEAQALLMSTRMSASACITIGHAATGLAKIASFEVSPSGTRVIGPSRAFLVHTNHFLRPPSLGDDTVPSGWPDTLRRYEELSEALSTAPRPISRRTLRRLLSSHAGGERSICCHASSVRHFGDRSETLASIVMDLSNVQLFVSDGSPCQADYGRFPV